MKLLMYGIGVLLSSIGLSFLFLYLNLFVLGYSFFEFVKFINTRFECWLFIIGLILIYISRKGRKENVLLLRRFTKFPRQ